MKKELPDYLKYLQNKWGDGLTAETYLFTSQKLNKPYNRVSISRLFSSIYIAYIYRGKVFSHRFLWNDENRYIPTEPVKAILKGLRQYSQY